MEFYVKFWSVPAADLVSVLDSCYDFSRLSLSQSRDVIAPLLRRVIVLIHVIGGRSLFLKLIINLFRV